MSVYTSRPAMRWVVPTVAAVAVVGGGVAVGQFAVASEPRLPERTAAELLVDLQNAEVAGLSGTVVQRADLGLPKIAELAAEFGGAAGALIGGSNTVKVWYAEPDKARLAVVTTLGESDIIRDGRDVWFWESRDNSARHMTLPKDEPDSADGEEPRPPVVPGSPVPASPQEAAEQALAAIDPSTEVTTSRNAQVAGRDAYQLALTPRDGASLIRQVRLAIDAETKLPLRVEILPRQGDDPAFEVAFTQVTFERPDDERFRFNPPPGVKVQEEAAEGEAAEQHADRMREHAEGAVPGKPGAADDAPRTTVVGEGWTSVLVARVSDGPIDPAALGAEAEAEIPKGAPGEAAEAADAITGALAMFDSLSKVEGPWGSGRLLESKLFSALVTDDGRVLVGAVTPQRLYEVAAAPAASLK